MFKDGETQVEDLDSDNTEAYIVNEPRVKGREDLFFL